MTLLQTRSFFFSKGGVPHPPHGLLAQCRLLAQGGTRPLLAPLLFLAVAVHLPAYPRRGARQIGGPHSWAPVGSNKTGVEKRRACISDRHVRTLPPNESPNADNGLRHLGAKNIWSYITDRERGRTSWDCYRAPPCFASRFVPDVLRRRSRCHGCGTHDFWTRRVYLTIAVHKHLSETRSHALR